MWLWHTLVFHMLKPANPLILWKCLCITYPPFFPILSNSLTPNSLSPPTTTPTVLSVVQFLWLNGWSHHIWCANLLNDNMDLHMHVEPLYLSTRRTLMCVLCNKVSSLLRHMLWFFTGTLIWYHTHTQMHTTHSGTSRLMHPCKYIFTPLVMCSQKLLLLH